MRRRKPLSLPALPWANSSAESATRAQPKRSSRRINARDHGEGFAAIRICFAVLKSSFPSRHGRDRVHAVLGIELTKGRRPRQPSQLLSRANLLSVLHFPLSVHFR